MRDASPFRYIAVAVAAFALAFLVALVALPLFSSPDVPAPATQSAQETSDKPAPRVSKTAQTGEKVTNAINEEPEPEPEAEPEPEPEVQPEPEQPRSFGDMLQDFGIFDFATYEGEGDGNLTFPIEGMPVLLTAVHYGTDHFVISTMAADSSQREVLASAAGPYNGVVSNIFSYGEDAYLHINADGPWTVTISPMASVARASNGATYGGDGIVLIEEQQISRLHLVHDGEGQFIVQASGANAAALLINTTGPCDEWVDWSDPESLIVIHASGDWTLGWE